MTDEQLTLQVNACGDKRWYRPDGSVCYVEYYLTGNKYWFDAKGFYHREDGPAIEYKNGNKEWYWHGEFHREGGPAIEDVNGDKEWYWHGEQVECATQEEFEQLIRLKAFW